MKSAFLFIAALLMSLGLTACGGSDGSGGNAQSSVGIAMTKADSVSLAGFIHGSTDLDDLGIQAFEPSSLFRTESNGDVVFRVAGKSYEAPASCVSVTNDTSGNTQIYVYTFTCPNINGNVEINVTSGSSGVNAVKIVTELTLTNSSGSSDTILSTTNATLDTSGVLTIATTFNNTFTSGGDTYVANGNIKEVITPDEPCEPCEGGTIQLTGSLTFTKNGAQVGQFTITSSDLEYSDNHITEGTIEIKSANDDDVLTFSDCGQVTLTDNGEALE